MSPPRSKTDAVAARFAWQATVALDKRAAGLPLRIAVVLSEMVCEAGYAFPGRDTLARMLGTDKRNVKDALKKLVDLGYLRIEANQRRGPKCSDKFWPVGAKDGSPVWSRYREVQSQRGSVDPLNRDDGQEPAEPVRGVNPPKRGVLNVDKGGAQTPRLLERSLELDSSSDPNGSAVADAPASPAMRWKGSEGEPIPQGFPDEQAMQQAASWAEIAGVRIDLKAVRRAFLNHHYSVRCRLTDWERSWHMWVETAIDQEAA